MKPVLDAWNPACPGEGLKEVEPLATDTMQAVRLHAPGELRLETVSRPVPGPDEVLIRVRACGLDGNLAAKRAHQGVPCPLPVIPGHAFSGEVAGPETGDPGLEPGQRVTAVPLLPCGACVHCRRGAQRLCEQSGFLGCTCDGACAQYVTVPRSQILALPREVSLEEGVMVEPAAAALHAWKKLALPVGSSVAVFGTDPLGALALQWAQRLGAGLTVAVDVTRERLEAMRGLGADATVETGMQDALAVIRELTRGRGVDGVIVAGGPREFGEQSLLAAARGGRVVWAGFRPGAGRFLTPRTEEAWREGEITLLGCCHYALDPLENDWEQALLFLERGLLAAEELVTHRLPLAQAKRGLDLMQEGEQYCNQVLVLPRF